MAEQTTPDTGVAQAQPSVEERMAAFLGRQEPADAEPEQEQAATQEATQPVEQAQGDGLTPEDIPSEEEPSPSTDAEFEIVHNGQPRKLTREETIRLAQQGFDYTQKTQELAEVRRVVAQNVQRSQELVQLAPIVAQDLAMVKALESQLAQWQNTDWVRLAADDPLEYPKYRAQYDKMVSEYQRAYGNLQNNATRLTQTQAALKAQQLQMEMPRVLERIPEWRDPAKYEKGAAEVMHYLVNTEGVDPAIASQLDNAAYVSIARKAMLYDRLLKAKGEKVKQLRSAPPMTKPNAPTAPSVAKANKEQEARARLKKTGDLRDAAAVLLNRMK